MAQRINFLDHGKYAFTYRNMAMGVGLWIGVCAVVELGFMAQTWYVKSKVTGRQEQLKALQSRQEQQIRLLEVAQTKEQTGSAIESLTVIFARTPRWSRPLVGLVHAHPAKIDLVQFASVPGEPGAERKAMLRGHAGSPEAMAALIEQLNKLPMYQNVMLSESTRDVDTGGLQFVVSAVINFATS